MPGTQSPPVPALPPAACFGAGTRLLPRTGVAVGAPRPPLGSGSTEAGPRGGCSEVSASARAHGSFAKTLHVVNSSSESYQSENEYTDGF